MAGDPLFQTGDFTFASGKKSPWKIECEVLSWADWTTLAAMLNVFLLPFGRVVGVPRGGVKLAHALRSHADPSSRQLLVVDDVWTTGGSMDRFITSLDLSQPDRAVIFAWNPVPPGVTALFQMPTRGAA